MDSKLQKTNLLITMMITFNVMSRLVQIIIFL